MSDERKPGLPTVGQVRAHADAFPLPQGGGAWLFTAPGKEPGFVALRAVAGGMEIRNLSGKIRQLFLPATWEAYTALPCDQQGNPLPLLEKLGRVKLERDDASDRAENEHQRAAAEEARRQAMAEHLTVLRAERDDRIDAWKKVRIRRRAWALLAVHRGRRLRQAARRVLELGREVRRLRRRAETKSATAAVTLQERDAARADAERLAIKADAHDKVARALHIASSEANRERIVEQVQYAARVRDEAQARADGALALREEAERERDAATARADLAEATVAQLRHDLQHARDHLRDFPDCEDCARRQAYGQREDPCQLKAALDDLAAMTERAEAAERARDAASQRAANYGARAGALHEAYEDLRAKHGGCRAWREQVERERDAAVAAVEDMLGDPGTPEGRALRALVRAAKHTLPQALESVYAYNYLGVIRAWVNDGDLNEAAAAMAIVLARRETEASNG